MQEDLHILNEPDQPPTFQSEQGHDSNIDLTAATRGLALRTARREVLQDQTACEHNLIILELTTDRPSEQRVGRRYNARKADWDRLFLETGEGQGSYQSYQDGSRQQNTKAKRKIQCAANVGVYPPRRCQAKDETIQKEMLSGKIEGQRSKQAGVSKNRL